jgi:hypothetical protein
VPTANIAKQSLGCRIDPPHDPRRVEDVAREVDAAERSLDVSTDCQAVRHFSFLEIG